MGTNGSRRLAVSPYEFCPDLDFAVQSSMYSTHVGDLEETHCHTIVAARTDMTRLAIELDDTDYRDPQVLFDEDFYQRE